MSHFRQMRAAERDQTETRAALKEFDVFFERYANSALTPEVKQNWCVARDRLSESRQASVSETPFQLSTTTAIDVSEPVSRTRCLQQSRIEIADRGCYSRGVESLFDPRLPCSGEPCREVMIVEHCTEGIC